MRALAPTAGRDGVADFRASLDRIVLHPVCPLNTPLGESVPHPYVLLYAAVPLDGHLDTRQGEARLLLSDKEDFDRAGSVSSGADAILVGAGTLRADNPRLLVNSPAARLAADKPEYPFEVTITATGELAPGWKL